MRYDYLTRRLSLYRYIIVLSDSTSPQPDIQLCHKYLLISFRKTYLFVPSRVKLLLAKGISTPALQSLVCGRDHHSICVNVIQRHTNSARSINHHTRQVTPTITNVIKPYSLSSSLVCYPKTVKKQENRTQQNHYFFFVF